MPVGPCAKRRVSCILVFDDGTHVTGWNDCENPQEVCPREAGEGYEKCASICRQRGHAEVQALRLAGERARGATAILVGHDHYCADCQRALFGAGVRFLTLDV